MQLYTPEWISQQVDALDDSANVIKEIISVGERTDEQMDRLDRNVRHLELMLSVRHIQEAVVDKYMYTASITAGKAWLAIP